METSPIKIILAPLQGFTDITFRNTFARHFGGVDGAMAPFIPTMGKKKLKLSRLKDVYPENNQMFTIPQILGNNAEDFIFLAHCIHDMGHQQINWNLGCPHAKVANKNRGSGLLMLPDKIDAFLDYVLPRILTGLSVKIRLGRLSKNEIYSLLPVFDKYPLDEIILHPRTGIQMYEGAPDHDAFAEARLLSRHPFVYNGDIRDLTSFQILRKKFPDIRAFMIGRGLLANPFLAERIKGIPSNENMIKRLKHFHDDLFLGYQTIYSGPAHLIGRMKGFWTYLGPSFRGKGKSLKHIMKSESIVRYKEVSADFFTKSSEFLY
ncbi:MAG: tRNA dihydrouridine synthase DusB [Desulfobacula sp. RIFOXYA12_FULL_46_16]|nr:MAG: tRNA dihydrouridine synthase DusB [Deltaproteobacteria bacterium RIFOXYC2_FULL_48_10]OGR20727.1 MAG: tRNA dihydrouridine synthase DusB [Desulfobacula sp. RIFOXYA12_FULL_46_16]OGR50003.1 MAG: tRNA dihydrouridine synthase DusB [Desulfobacula sp. RIFOXYB2_FULL_45_6]